MASGDTKTEAMLNALGNGGSADEFRGCCNTKTQQYILDAIDRVQNVEDEVEELKNNPDVVDIVDTYADLQAYDTQHLTENDIIRVLQDETHSGNSTYYRFTKNPDTWTFIGESASAGGDIKTLSTDDYNYPTNNPDRVALWLLPNGLYRIPTSGVSVYYASNSIWTFGHGDFVIIEKYQAGAKPICMYFFGSTDGVEYCEVSTSGNLNRALAYTILSDRVSQSTGNDQYRVMSQNAVTSMVFADPANKYSVQIGSQTAGSSPNHSVAIGNSTRVSTESVVIGENALTNGDNQIAIGRGAVVYNANARGCIALGDQTKINGPEHGVMSIAPTSTAYGYNSTNYRLLTGLYDPVNDHDAATKGYVDANAGGPTVVQNKGTSTTDVMSQDAVGKAIYDYVDSSGRGYRPKIGDGAYTGGMKSMAIGDDSSANGQNAVALGGNAKAWQNGAIALGYGATTSSIGEMNIGSSSTSYGYNSTNYRLLSGVYDGQSAHDAVTVGQVNSVIDAINTALSTNIPHIGA